MYKYRNTVTGAEIMTTSKCAGGNWEEISSAPAAQAVEKTEPAPKDETKKTRVKNGKK